MRTRSEMDASVVDLETVLVDAHTVDVGDVSIDSSPSDLEDNEDDKVMVTIRVRPTESSQSAFIISPSNASLQLPSDDQPKKWNFGAVHGQGSSNKDLFGTSARKVVRRAMGGFNGYDCLTSIELLLKALAGSSLRTVKLLRASLIPCMDLEQTTKVLLVAVSRKSFATSKKYTFYPSTKVCTHYIHWLGHYT
jgi:hypothetical protein